LENCWTDAKVVVGEDNSKLFFKGYQFFFLKTTVE
jgi:hypothetical protein